MNTDPKFGADPSLNVQIRMDRCLEGDDPNIRKKDYEIKRLILVGLSSSSTHVVQMIARRPYSETLSLQVRQRI